MRIRAKLIEIQAQQSGVSQRGNQWVLQDFIAEYTAGNYTHKICFQLFGSEKVEIIKDVHIGDEIDIDFDIESHEYNGKWFTKCVVWQITALNTTSSTNAYPTQKEAVETQENNSEPEWSF